MNSYKELEVWKKSIDLVESIYKVSGDFPINEKYGLTSQIRRSGVSIPSNIAEGWGRMTTQDYIHFLVIARGSLLELETQVIIATRLNYFNEATEAQVQNQIAEINKMLNKMINILRNKI